MLSFSALADPTRHRIVEMLANHELSSGEIAERFEISAPAVSQHLKVLRAAGLVRVRVDAQRRIYEIDPAGFSELEHWLYNMKQFWSGRLDVLESQLHSTPAKSRRKGNGHRTSKNY